jgi:hypothetical protein
VKTNAGRDAKAMIRDDLLDVALWQGTVRLRVQHEPFGEARRRTER